MKTLTYKSLFAALLINLIFGSNTFALQQEKVIEKSFKVTSATLIDIDNKFGQVHVNTWDKNEVAVRVVIEVDSKNPEEVFNKIDVIFEDRISDNYLGIKTQLDDIRGKSSFSINYTVDMPKKNKLSLKNKFGDTYVADLAADVEINIGYGLLKAGNLTGNTDLFLEFGSGTSQVESISNGELTIKYSKIAIDQSGNMDVNAQFSEVYGKSFSTVSLSLKYGKFIVSKTDAIEGDSQFSDINVDVVKGDINLDLKHTQFNIGNLGQSVNNIFLDGQFSKMNVNLPSGISMDFNLDFKFADLKYRGDKITFYKIIKENTSKEYQGYLGREKSGKTFTVISKYGDLSLEIL